MALGDGPIAFEAIAPIAITWTMEPEESPFILRFHAVTRHNVLVLSIQSFSWQSGKATHL